MFDNLKKNSFSNDFIKIENIEERRSNDVAIFKNEDESLHVAVFLNEKFIYHLLPNKHSVIESFDNSLFKKKIISLYRHKIFVKKKSSY